MNGNDGDDHRAKCWVTQGVKEEWIKEKLMEGGEEDVGWNGTPAGRSPSITSKRDSKSELF